MVQKTKPSGGFLAVALFFSFLLPGVGHLMYRRWLDGVLFFFGVMLGYVCFIIPGVVLHLICLVDLGLRVSPNTAHCPLCLSMIPAKASRCYRCAAELTDAPVLPAGLLALHRAKTTGVAAPPSVPPEARSSP